MIKQPNHKECKVSGRVFTSFRWRPGAEARYKETVISPEVARAKGVCQCCLMDMEFNLPVGVRDALLKGSAEEQALIPQSGVNQTWHYDQVAKCSREDVEAGYGKMATDKLLKMSRSSPYYDRNLPKLCSFWIKGQCSRVVEGTCPFRPCCGTFRFPELAGSNPDAMRKLIHLLENDGPTKVMRDKGEEVTDLKDQLHSSQKGSRDQNIRDRYHGVDQLTQKYLGKAEQMALTLPDDKTITTLYVGLMGQQISEKDLSDQFYAYGEIKSIAVMQQSNCAFVTYTTREAAEKAADKLHNNLMVRGMKLRVMWGRAQKTRGPEGVGGVPQPIAPMMSQPQQHGGSRGIVAPIPYMPYGVPPPPPGRPPAPPQPGVMHAAPVPRAAYPSMDPAFHGTRPDRLPPPPPGRPPMKK